VRALRSWPRVRRLAATASAVYLNGAVCGRLLPALSAGRARQVLHIHDLVARVPRFWRQADLVLAASGDPYRTDPAYTRAVLSSPEVETYRWSINAPELMRHLEVPVLPSYEEPFGTVVAEAMAVGTPVVATRVGGLAEVVADGVTGRLVSPGDPDRLSAAVLEVLAHRDRWAPPPGRPGTISTPTATPSWSRG
jgi:glycosyltransferase involved in cell wall biosynthesis